MASKTKPVPQSTITAINNAAAKVAVLAPTFAAGDGKAFEAWVLMEAAAELSIKHKVEARDHKGTKTTTFRVCGGPSYLPSKHSTAPDEPCHFLIGAHRELHSSLRHVGRSGDSHELDISIICTHSADHHRSGPKARPYSGEAFLAIELKEYDAGHSLPKTYARALLGTALDISPFHFIGPIEVTFKALDTSVCYWSHPWSRSISYALMTTADLTGPTVHLLNHYSVASHRNVVVSSSSPAIAALLSVF
jgi:hypothetical protein